MEMPEDILQTARKIAFADGGEPGCHIEYMMATAINAERERGKIKIAQAYQALLNVPTASDSEVARLLDYLLGDEVDEDFLPWPRQANNEETV